MAMARLPVLRKRRSRREQTLDDLSKRWAKAWTVAKTSPAATRVAISGATTYAASRWSTSRRRSKTRLLVIPVAVAGGVVVMRKLRSSDDGHEAEIDRPLGPVASADTVSPPADAAAEAAKAESAS
jgi:hypothetical protein